MSTNYLSNKCKKLAGDALGALTTLKLVLVTSAYTPDKDNDFMSSATANEASTTNYAGGYGGGGRKTVASIAVTQDNTNDLMKLTFAAVTWTNIGVPAGYAVRYALLIQETGGSDATSPILATYDLNSGADFTLNGGDFTVTPNASGALTIT